MDDMKDSANAHKGFTLIEVLISMAILSIGLLAVASMQISASLQARNSLDISEANAIASYQMETLMQMPYVNVVSSSTNAIPAAEFSIAPNQFSIQWTVTPADLNGDGINEAKSIDLTVTRISSQRRVELVFIKHDDLAL
jgi:prepilin-type N-terminal cleavage/methylation domain-containing protein